MEKGSGKMEKSSDDSTEKFFTAVRLDADLCVGCINCIKRCPTEAIRVRNGKAHIRKEFCIDCGECIRICQHHAKQAVYDSLSTLEDFKYTVALPAPSLYTQANHLDDINIVLNALLKMGFDDVYEVSAAAEIVSKLSASYVKEHPEKQPVISTACPSVTRLIRVRFPDLLSHLLPIKAPVDLAAEIARKRAIEITGLPPEDIGIFFISPCAAKVSAIKHPLGYDHSEVDRVLAIKEVYPPLIKCMQEVVSEGHMLDLVSSGQVGISWGASGGEAEGLASGDYLAADGMENIVRVLEDIENNSLEHLEFIELNACSGGCVGGVLTVENPFVAKVKLKHLIKTLPVKEIEINRIEIEPYWTKPVSFEPVYKLSNNLKQSIAMLHRIDELAENLPQLDCGACGAPTCRALAEDVVKGLAHENDCIHVFRKQVNKISEEFKSMDNFNL